MVNLQKIFNLVLAHGQYMYVIGFPWAYSNFQMVKIVIFVGQCYSKMSCG